ncbi:ABC-F family ATP-binding cassette domain-containing protein [Nitrospirillum viridazoti]|uniref:ATP-binding protein Uup n=1 Tax=Nitrospirillum viridazoti CBAmc TaxID=1441467 RepID=A0A248JSN9_9PROT|nr:ATP-binding cassette domain-containing protein [Nitrospirillum amazonense]ASG21108.1 elongation factor 3 [Nitrospirillum amazonense CBAmc]TWB26143.1 ATP-binding cassette subfamily F protein uup [Nitrospirillum amazonense]
MAPTPPIVALKNAHITLGATILFEGVDVAIGRGDKIALVGRNGSGKSTLLKALAGVVDLDKGERYIQPGARIGYLHQEPDFSGHATVADFVSAGLVEDAPYRVQAVLDELNLPGVRAAATLSGGEARRAAIAQALVSDPDVLLMDEPTNHLDLPTIEYLEKALQAFRGGLLLISHDRAFLNNLARKTMWLDRGTMRETERPFAEFEAWRDEVFAAEDLAYAKLDRKIAVEMKWLREGISARRTRNMGRVRALHGLRKERADRNRQGQVKLAVSDAENSGRLVIEATHVAKSFQDAEGNARIIARDFSTRILRGDRVGLIGPNGAGKTTILKMLMGELAPDSGTIRLGTNLETVVFDQRRAQLDPNQTIRQVLLPFGGDSVVVGGTPRHVASYMRDFLFDAGMLEQPTRALSGGERNRLLLAKLFAQPSNLMVLDEPTNDLDMDTLDLLEEVLSDYPGTLLLVSHDRDFLDRLVTSTIAVEGDGVVAEYAGGYSDYLVQRPARTPTAGAAAKTADAPKAAEAPKAKRKLGYKEQRELDQLPALMDKLGDQVKKLEAKLADANLYARDPAAFQKTSSDLDKAHQDLATAEERWLELEALKEELESGA